MRVRLVGRCTAVSVASALLGKPTGHVVLDLEAVTWCDSSGLVALACLAQHGLETGATIEVLAPTNGDVANYISRMRLGYVLDGLGATHSLPDVAEHTVTSLFELSEFDGAEGATELADMAHDHLYETDPVGADALLNGLGETAENVHEHSGRVSGFAAAQRYRDGRLNFSVGDAGIGVLGSLAKFGAMSDEQAIQIALRRGGTGSGDIGRGNGLPNVLERTCAAGGALTVISGTSAITAREHSRRSMELPSAFPGTLIFGVLPLAN